MNNKLKRKKSDSLLKNNNFIYNQSSTKLKKKLYELTNLNL